MVRLRIAGVERCGAEASVAATRYPADSMTVWFSGPGLALPLTYLRAKMRTLEVVRSRRGARVDESTCLESMRLGNGTVGSNPTLSAIQRSIDCWHEPGCSRVEKAYEYYRGRALCNRTL